MSGDGLTRDGSESGERRGRVAQMLLKRSPRLSGLYEVAHSALQGKAIENGDIARVSIICHCMRELMLNLPTAMADDVIERPDPSSTSLAAGLPDLLARHPDLDLGVDQDLIPVPKPVAQAIDRLVATVAKEKGRNRTNAAALLTGGTDPGHPIIRQWSKAYGFFVGWAHLDRNHERGGDLPSDVEILRAINVVEDVIEIRSKEFFENLHSVQDLLAEINSTSWEDE